jgi:hypothetical protein
MASWDPLSDIQAQSLQHLPRLASPDTPIRSRILGDVWHLMDQFKISLHHGLRCPFARALRDALLIPDASDKAAVSRVLDTLHTSYGLMVLTNAEWVWAHVKRFIPEPEILLPRVTQVLQTFGPLRDSTTGQPLFNDASWEKARAVLENIRLGYYSDPPGVSLYTTQSAFTPHMEPMPMASTRTDVSEAQTMWRVVFIRTSDCDLGLLMHHHVLQSTCCVTIV